MKLSTRTSWAVVAAVSLLAAACGDDLPTTSPFEAPPALNITGYGSTAPFTFNVPDGFGGAAAQWTSGYTPGTSVGTGVIRPFLDMQNPGGTSTEEGFNTDNDAFVYNQHRTSDTNALPLNYVPVLSILGGVREFVLDGHESDNFFTIEEFEVYLCFSDAARTYSTKAQVTANCAPVYEINDVIDATDQFSSGSGNVFDYRILIPEVNFLNAAPGGTQLCPYNPSPAAEAACHQYIIAWSRMTNVGSTFEEFSTILRPAITVEKTPDGQLVDAGNNITFTMVVSNSGSGTATGVTLSDNLPGGSGINWSTTTPGCTVTGPLGSQVLSCTLGDLDELQSVNVTVTSPTDQTSCAVYDNTATVSSTNAGSDSDPGQITVQNCKGTIIIEKVTVGGFGGPFPYTTTGSGLSGFNLTTTAAGAAGKATQTFNNVLAGSYSVTEGTLPAGWSFTSLSCTTGGAQVGSTTTANITLVGGATVTCTYTNTKLATIVIEKVTVGGFGGPFAYTTTGTGLSSFNLTTTAAGAAGKDTKTFSNLQPGSYSVTESAPPTGWEFTSLSCTTGGSQSGSTTTANITVAAGETVTCTYTNTKQATIVIEKVTVGGFGGPFAYTTSGTGLSAFNLTTTAAGAAGKDTKTFSNLSPGAYSVTESAPPSGWEFTSLSCTTGGAQSGSTTTANITLAAGATVTCTYTNTKQGSIVIEKVTVGGFSGPFAYTTSGTGLSGFNLTTTAAGAAGKDTKTFSNLSPGSYAVTESAPPSGWEFTSLSCTTGGAQSGSTTTANITLAAGATVTCTYTNTKQAILRIAKATNPDGSLVDFTFTPTGGWNSGATFTRRDNQTAFSSGFLSPGTYGAVETIPSDWQLTGRACVNTSGGSSHAFSSPTAGVSVTLGAGEDVTCTFTNTELATLIITKTANTAASFNFSRFGCSTATPSSPGDCTSDLPGALLENFSMGNGGSQSTLKVLAQGTYLACELGIPVSSYSVSVTLTDGANANPAAVGSFVGGVTETGNGNFCVAVPLLPGETRTVAFTNIQATGSTRTIGYWKNWSSCSKGRQYEKAEAAGELDKTLDGNLPQTLGSLVVDDCEEAFNLLSKSGIDGSKKPGDPIYNMVAQLLGAKLNLSAGSGSCPAADTAIAAADALLISVGFNGVTGYKKNSLTSAQTSEANSLAAILDDFNNGTLGGGCPTHAG